MNLKYKYDDINSAASRYVVYDDDLEIGEVTFTKAGNSIYIIDHTFVNPDYRGNKIANELVKLVVQKAKEDGKSIVPLCPFAKKEFDRTPEYQEVEKK